MHTNGAHEAAAGPAAPASGPSERALASKTVAWLFWAGASLALLTSALPHPAAVDEAGLVTLAIAAFAIAGAVALASPLGPFWLNLVAIVATAVITGALYFGDREIGAFSFFYLWVILFAAYFLTRRQAALQLVVVALAYAVLLVVAGNDDSSPVATWVLTVGSLLVAGVLVRMLKERVEGLLAELSLAADHDHLTGLLNRRGFSRRLDEELERARRSERPLGLVIGDLDCFKEVNDRFGHQAGDDVLQRVGTILFATNRVIDAAARIGGEEFALILPFTDRAGAHAAAEKLRKRLRAAFAADELPLTISLGTATLPEDGEDVGSLMRAADRALYTAKALGRDRSCLPSDGSARQDADTPPSPDALPSTRAAHEPTVPSGPRPHGRPPTVAPPRTA